MNPVLAQVQHDRCTGRAYVHVQVGGTLAGVLVVDRGFAEALAARLNAVDWEPHSQLATERREAELPSVQRLSDDQLNELQQMVNERKPNAVICHVKQATGNDALGTCAYCGGKSEMHESDTDKDACFGCHNGRTDEAEQSSCELMTVDHLGTLLSRYPPTDIVYLEDPHAGPDHYTTLFRPIAGDQRLFRGSVLLQTWDTHNDQLLEARRAAETTT